MAGTILLVEDNPDDVTWACFAFKRAGIQNPIHVVRSGEEAMQFLARDGGDAAQEIHPLPILVLLDVILPRKSGYDVLRWIKGEPELATIPVIVLSGVSDLAHLGKARELGALTFMLKPLRPEQLIDRFTQSKGLRVQTKSDGGRYLVSESLRNRRLTQARPEKV